MRAAVTALSRAAGNLFDARIVAIVFVPMLGSLFNAAGAIVVFALLVRRSRGDPFLLGVLVSLLLYVLVVNLLVPVMGSRAFTHFCLLRLAVSRGEMTR